MKASTAPTQPAQPPVLSPDPATSDEESLDELPPLDGDGEDAKDGDETAEDLDDLPGGSLDPLDDATGEGEPLDELAAEGGEGGWLDDSAEAEELDIGGHGLDLEERADLLSDVDEPGVGDEDFGLDGGGSQAAIDSGEEGPDAADDELRVEDLPRLDADGDEEGDLEDATMVERWSYAPEAVEEARPAWDDRAWDRTLLLTRSGLEAAGVLGGAVIALSFAAGVLLVATDDPSGPGVYGSSDQGKSFALSPGFRLVKGAIEAVGDDAARNAAPELMRAADGTLAMTLDGVVVPVPSLDAATIVDVPVALLARGNAVALCPPGAGVYRAVDSTLAFSRIDGTASGTALSFVDDAGALLIALHSETEERAWLVRVDAGGIAGIVAELGGDDGEDVDTRVLAIAWDDAKGTAWAAGAFGLAAFRPN